MKKYSALILLPCAFALLLAERVGAAPVEWDFIATGCTPSAYGGGCLSGQHYPVTLATLTLPGPDSSGTAVFGGWGPGSTYPARYTGDSFVLEWSDWPALTPAFVQNNEPFGECEHHGEMCMFDLSWSEHAGQLDALQLLVYGIEDTFIGRLGDVIVASDYIYRSGNFAGCDYASQCQISGFWVNDALVTAPEPGALALLASAFGVWGLAVRHANRNERNLIRLPHAGLDFFGGRGVTEFPDAGSARLADPLYGGCRQSQRPRPVACR